MLLTLSIILNVVWMLMYFFMSIFRKETAKRWRKESEQLKSALAAKDKHIAELEGTEKAARNLYDNRLGWSDGRNPYAPPEFWNSLKQALTKGKGGK